MEMIPIPGAEIYYDKNFFSPGEATALFQLLKEKCDWERRKSSFKYAVPRDEAKRISRSCRAVAAWKRVNYGGQTQKNFKHEVPKELGVEQPRINLTFRRIQHS